MKQYILIFLIINGLALSSWAFKYRPSEVTSSGNCLYASFIFAYDDVLDQIAASPSVEVTEIPDYQLPKEKMRRIRTTDGSDFDFFRVAHEDAETYFLMYFGKGRSINLYDKQDNMIQLIYSRGDSCKYKIDLKPAGL